RVVRRRAPPRREGPGQDPRISRSGVAALGAFQGMTPDFMRLIIRRIGEFHAWLHSDDIVIRSPLGISLCLALVAGAAIVTFSSSEPVSEIADFPRALCLS